MMHMLNANSPRSAWEILRTTLSVIAILELSPAKAAISGLENGRSPSVNPQRQNAGMLLHNAEAFDPNYDTDSELEERRVAVQSGTKSHRSAIGWDDISRWIPTNTLQIRFWADIDTLAIEHAKQSRDDMGLAASGLSLPEAIERALMVETACLKLVSSWPETDGREEASKLKSLIRCVDDSGQRTALRMRCVRIICAPPVIWSPRDPWSEQSKSVWAEATRSDIVKWLVDGDGPELRGNIVVACRIAKLVGEYERCHHDAKALRISATSTIDTARFGPVATDGTLMSENLFDLSAGSLRPFISNYASAGLLGCDKESRRRWVVDICKLMGETTPAAFSRLDDKFLWQLSNAHGDYSELEQRALAAVPHDSIPAPPSDEWRIEPHGIPTELSARMAGEQLEAGFVRHVAHSVNSSETNRIGYLIIAPKNASGKVPMIVFLPGSGEIGSDLSKVFRQRTILDIVRSNYFQEKHPCYLLVLSVPDGTSTLSGNSPDGRPTPIQRALHDSLFAIARTRKRPTIDERRIYITGLSHGGTGAYSMTFAYPGLFAASVPVAAHIFSATAIGDILPCEYFHLWNEGEARQSPNDMTRLESFGARVRELGGDFRVGTFPNEGHNAWDAAWRDEAVWDWMFSKRRGANGAAARATGRVPDPTRSIGGGEENHAENAGSAEVRPPAVTASKPGRDGRTGPERAADGLDGTAYVSASPVSAGDWLQVEWSAPVQGRIEVRTGLPDGTLRLSKGRVEVSVDGRVWSRTGTVSQKTGVCAFQQRTGIRFLRLLPEPRLPEPLAVREIAVKP